MSEVVRIADFKDHVGQEVRLQGWLHNKRSSGKLQFLIVRDGSGFAQAVVAKAAVSPESWAAAEQMGQESSLELTGRVKEDQRAPGEVLRDRSNLRRGHPRRPAPRRPEVDEHRDLVLPGGRVEQLRVGVDRLCQRRQHGLAGAAP